MNGFPAFLPFFTERCTKLPNLHWGQGEPVFAGCPLPFVGKAGREAGLGLALPGFPRLSGRVVLHSG